VKSVAVALTAAVAGALLTVGSAHDVSASSVCFTNKTAADGLASNTLRSVYVANSNLYVGTFDNGVSISSDNGDTFAIKNQDNGGPYNVVLDIYAVGSNVYTANSAGLSVSSDDGGTFARYRSNGMQSNFVRGVYAVASTVYAATQNGLSISTDNGATFANTRTTSNGLGDNFLWDVHVVGSSVYAATDGGLSISTDNGATFTNRTTADGIGSNTVYDVDVVGSAVYAATDGGLSISTDAGATFTNKSTTDGIGSNRVWGVDVVGSHVYAATSAGLSISTDGGATFTNRTTADGLANNGVHGVYADSSGVYAATSSGLSILTDCAPASRDGSGSSGTAAPTVDISFDQGCPAMSDSWDPTVQLGEWKSLPSAIEISVPVNGVGDTLLGYATTDAFPVSIARRQVDNGWGAYEIFDEAGLLSSIFIPTGGAAHVTATPTFFCVWAK